MATYSFASTPKPQPTSSQYEFGEVKLEESLKMHRDERCRDAAATTDVEMGDNMDCGNERTAN